MRDSMRGHVVAIQFLRFKGQIADSQGLIFSDKTGHMVFKDSIDVTQRLGRDDINQRG